MNSKQVILTVCQPPAAGSWGRYGCKYNSLRKLCDNTLKTNKNEKKNNWSLLVMNVRASCIYVNMRDSKLYDDMYCLKKKRKRKVNKSRFNLLFSLVIHCLYKEFSEMHFIIFTVYNSKCISYDSK